MSARFSLNPGGGSNSKCSPRSPQLGATTASSSSPQQQPLRLLHSFDDTLQQILVKTSVFLPTAPISVSSTITGSELSLLLRVRDAAVWTQQRLHGQDTPPTIAAASDLFYFFVLASEVFHRLVYASEPWKPPPQPSALLDSSRASAASTARASLRSLLFLCLQGIGQLLSMNLLSHIAEAVALVCELVKSLGFHCGCTEATVPPPEGESLPRPWKLTEDASLLLALVQLLCAVAGGEKQVEESSGSPAAVAGGLGSRLSPNLWYTLVTLWEALYIRTEEATAVAAARVEPQSAKVSAAQSSDFSAMCHSSMSATRAHGSGLNETEADPVARVVEGLEESSTSDPREASSSRLWQRMATRSPTPPSRHDVFAREVCETILQTTIAQALRLIAKGEEVEREPSSLSASWRLGRDSSLSCMHESVQFLKEALAMIASATASTTMAAPSPLSAPPFALARSPQWVPMSSCGSEVGNDPVVAGVAVGAPSVPPKSFSSLFSSLLYYKDQSAPAGAPVECEALAGEVNAALAPYIRLSLSFLAGQSPMVCWMLGTLLELHHPSQVQPPSAPSIDMRMLLLNAIFDGMDEVLLLSEHLPSPRAFLFFQLLIEDLAPMAVGLCQPSLLRFLHEKDGAISKPPPPFLLLWERCQRLALQSLSRGLQCFPDASSPTLDTTSESRAHLVAALQRVLLQQADLAAQVLCFALTTRGAASPPATPPLSPQQTGLDGGRETTTLSPLLPANHHAPFAVISFELPPNLSVAERKGSQGGWTSHGYQIVLMLMQMWKELMIFPDTAVNSRLLRLLLQKSIEVEGSEKAGSPHLHSPFYAPQCSPNTVAEENPEFKKKMRQEQRHHGKVDLLSENIISLYRLFYRPAGVTSTTGFTAHSLPLVAVLLTLATAALHVALERRQERLQSLVQLHRSKSPQQEIELRIAELTSSPIEPLAATHAILVGFLRAARSVSPTSSLPSLSEGVAHLTAITMPTLQKALALADEEGEEILSIEEHLRSIVKPQQPPQKRKNSKSITEKMAQSDGVFARLVREASRSAAPSSAAPSTAASTISPIMTTAGAAATGGGMARSPSLLPDSPTLPGVHQSSSSFLLPHHASGYRLFEEVMQCVVALRKIHFLSLQHPSLLTLSTSAAALLSKRCGLSSDAPSNSQRRELLSTTLSSVLQAGGWAAPPSTPRGEELEEGHRAKLSQSEELLAPLENYHEDIEEAELSSVMSDSASPAPVEQEKNSKRETHEVIASAELPPTKSVRRWWFKPKKAPLSPSSAASLDPLRQSFGSTSTVVPPSTLPTAAFTAASSQYRQQLLRGEQRVHHTWMQLEAELEALWAVLKPDEAGKAEWLEWSPAIVDAVTDVCRETLLRLSTLLSEGVVLSMGWKRLSTPPLGAALPLAQLSGVEHAFQRLFHRNKRVRYLLWLVCVSLSHQPRGGGEGRGEGGSAYFHVFLQRITSSLIAHSTNEATESAAWPLILECGSFPALQHLRACQSWVELLTLLRLHHTQSGEPSAAAGGASSSPPPSVLTSLNAAIEACQCYLLHPQTLLAVTHDLHAMQDASGMHSVASPHAVPSSSSATIVVKVFHHVLLSPLLSRAHFFHPVMDRLDHPSPPTSPSFPSEWLQPPSLHELEGNQVGPQLGKVFCEVILDPLAAAEAIETMWRVSSTGNAALPSPYSPIEQSEGEGIALFHHTCVGRSIEAVKEANEWWRFEHRRSPPCQSLSSRAVSFVQLARLVNTVCERSTQKAAAPALDLSQLSLVIEGLSFYKNSQRLWPTAPPRLSTPPPLSTALLQRARRLTAALLHRCWSHSLFLFQAQERWCESYLSALEGSTEGEGSADGRFRFNAIDLHKEEDEESRSAAAVWCELAQSLRQLLDPQGLQWAEPQAVLRALQLLPSASDAPVVLHHAWLATPSWKETEMSFRVLESSVCIKRRQAVVHPLGRRLMRPFVLLLFSLLNYQSNLTYTVTGKRGEALLPVPIDSWVLGQRQREGTTLEPLTDRPQRLTLALNAIQLLWALADSWAACFDKIPTVSRAPTAPLTELLSLWELLLEQLVTVSVKDPRVAVRQSAISTGLSLWRAYRNQRGSSHSLLSLQTIAGTRMLWRWLWGTVVTTTLTTLFQLHSTVWALKEGSEEVQVSVLEAIGGLQEEVQLHHAIVERVCACERKIQNAMRPFVCASKGQPLPTGEEEATQEAPRNVFKYRLQLSGGAPCTAVSIFGSPNAIMWLSMLHEGREGAVRSCYTVTALEKECVAQLNAITRAIGESYEADDYASPSNTFASGIGTGSRPCPTLLSERDSSVAILGSFCRALLRPNLTPAPPQQQEQAQGSPLTSTRAAKMGALASLTSSAAVASRPRDELGTLAAARCARSVLRRHPLPPALRRWLVEMIRAEMERIFQWVRRLDQARGAGVDLTPYENALAALKGNWTIEVCQALLLMGVEEWTLSAAQVMSGWVAPLFEVVLRVHPSVIPTSFHLHFFSSIYSVCMWGGCSLPTRYREDGFTVWESMLRVGLLGYALPLGSSSYREALLAVLAQRFAGSTALRHMNEVLPLGCSVPVAIAALVCLRAVLLLPRDDGKGGVKELEQASLWYPDRNEPPQHAALLSQDEPLLEGTLFQSCPQHVLLREWREEPQTENGSPDGRNTLLQAAHHRLISLVPSVIETLGTPLLLIFLSSSPSQPSIAGQPDPFFFTALLTTIKQVVRLLLSHSSAHVELYASLVLETVERLSDMVAVLVRMFHLACQSPEESSEKALPSPIVAQILPQILALLSEVLEKSIGLAPYSNRALEGVCASLNASSSWKWLSQWVTDEGKESAAVTKEEWQLLMIEVTRLMKVCSN